MIIMKYIKGTLKQCQQYNDIVSIGERYQGATQKWADPIKCEGFYCIPYNDKYPTNLEVIDNLPVTLIK